MMSDLTSMQVATLLRKTRLDLIQEIKNSATFNGIMDDSWEDLLHEYMKGLQIKDESEVIDIIYNHSEDEELASLR